MSANNCGDRPCSEAPAPGDASLGHVRVSPVSFSQQSLWLLDRLLPLGSASNFARTARLDGALDVDALRRSLNEIVRRHEALRTHFGAEAGVPVQMIAPELDLGLRIEDLRELPIELREATARQRAREEACALFDLAHGPLIQVRLLWLAEHEHWLLLTFHHIVVDDWSMKVLWRELSTLYDAQRAASPSPLPALSVQYADYSVSQREWLQGGVLEPQLAYWQQTLAQLPSLELPTDRARPVQASFRGRQMAFALGESVTRSVRALGHREGTTLFTTLLAAFQVLLYRYSGQEDFAIGVPISGRRRPEVEGLIGYFVNTLVLRADLSEEPSFTDYLARVRIRTLAAYAHQDVPFERLVEELRPTRDLSRNPLVQVLFNKRMPEAQTLRLAGLKPADVEATETGSSRFDLEFTVVEKHARCHITVVYATDLFDAATIERMAGHFTTLLEGIIAHPAQPISRVPLLPPAEREQLLVQWNDTARDFPLEVCVHQLFEQQVAASPGAIAVVCGAQQLTYAELNAQANQLAHWLRARGIGPDVLVGLFLDRSLATVIALLGTLKAGGAYVPLDASYPAERLAFMLADTQAPVLLTQQRLLERLPEHTMQTLCLDQDWAEVASQPDSNLPCPATAANLAYVIYTSGSTGTPKGVMIPHRALVNHMQWMRETFAFDNNDSVLQKTPIGADAAVWEFYAPLLSGGRLVMAPPDAHRDPVQIVRALREHDVTTVQLVPSLFRLLAQEPGIADCVHLKRVFCGGEALPGEAAQCFFERSGAHLYNLYGPTETCIDSLSWECQRDVASATVPIGRPIANTAVYVLDQHRQPVPVGVAGELYIGGDGLARGYWNRLELTAERFVADPFAQRPNATMYRTGDRVRYLPDGTLDFLGRLDQQLKLRGFRIEPGEIEAVLVQHAAVREAVVLLREDIPGDKRLVAYVIAREGGVVTADLRAFLKQRLPEYMVPAAFVPLPAFPLTPNAKLDRKALPAPESGANATTESPPRNPLEEAICGIWCELLHRRQVGVHDNFFDVGGHSLLAIQLLSWLRDVFRIDLSVRALFEAPTIAELAARIGALRAENEANVALPVKQVRRTVDLPLSFVQQRLWFLEQWEPGSALYNIAGGWWLRGPLDVARLRLAFGLLVARHESLRTAFVSEQGQPRQRVLAEVAVELRLVDLGALPVDEARTQALSQAEELAHRGFALGEAPLLRLSLMRVAESTHLLVLAIHHIVADGWSMGVFFRELGALYAGTGPPLPALPVQYPDYASWQRQWLVGDELERQLNYWKTKLADLSPLLLPTDRPRPPVSSYRGAHRSLLLSGELTAALKRSSQRERVTLYMLLLAAFQVLLARYSGQDDIAVGSPIAGRNRSEFEGLIGFFVNTLVLRTDLAGDLSFRECLSRVRESALDAYAHQELPFEKLVEELRPERDLSRNPLIQAMFVLQNIPRVELTLAGVEVTPLKLETATAKFDLTLTLAERANVLVGDLEYATDLFDAATIERMAGHFTTLLEGIVTDPGQAISRLPLLPPAERRQLSVQWNDTARDYPREQCIHQRFEQQAAASPGAIAVVCGAQQLSYAELNTQANQLAYWLRKRGVGPDVLVGLCTERSLASVVGMLGILKAGGAYVPLDPGFPTQRLTFMLADAGVAVLLTQHALRDALPPTAVEVLCVDAPCPELEHEPTHNPTPVNRPEHLAYLIYTSGSTGTPKGVMVPHRGVMRLVCNTDYIELEPRDSVAHVSNLSFDAATFEIWGALANGARLHVIPREDVLDPPRFAEALSHGEISALFLTTAMFNEIVRFQPRVFAGVKNVLFGGEAVDPRWVRECLNAGAPQRLVHVYGPTETVTFATWHRVDAVESGQRTIPIGRPIANSVVYVLDRQQQPVPVGVSGELYIGGDGMARGYWQRPELTAERFVADPFTQTPDATMYRTGDLVRYLPDGNLEFLGRLDHQLKLRGFRIEPGEIEAVLVQHAQVREAVVLLREDVPGDRRLVGYVVAASAALAAADLKAWLKPQLPDYMLPTALVLLPALPLTANGKIDRKALPAPTGERMGQMADAVAPRDNIELHLAKIWEDLLKRSPIGVHDGFFDLGGHSLLAVQLMDRIDKAFHRRLPLDTLWFRGGTIEALATILRDEYQSGVNPELVPMKTGSRRPLFVVHTMGGNLFHYYELSRHLDAEQAVYGLQARGVYGTGRPDHTIESIATHCLETMRTAQPTGSYLVAGFSSGGVVAFELAQQLAAAGQRVALLALLDTYAPKPGTGRRWAIELTALVQRRAQLRHVQELAYFSLLHPLRLDRLRNLRTVGEAHRWAHWSYQPRPYAHPIEFFIANDTADREGSGNLGWVRWFADTVRIHRLPGTHGNLVKPPVVEELAVRLQACIDSSGED